MKRIVILYVLLMLSAAGFSTHLRSGYISVERVQPLQFRYRITLTVYTNTGSPVLFGGDNDVLEFGDGNSILVPETPADLRPDLGPGIGVAQFTTVHTYSSPGSYVVSYSEPNLLDGAVNVTNSANFPLLLHTSFMVDPVLPFTETPAFLSEPYFMATAGVPFSLSVAVDNTEDIFSYYAFYPHHQITIPPSMTIDPYTGVVSWDTQFRNAYTLGSYIIPIHITFSRFVDGQYVTLGQMMRLVQINLVDASSEGYISHNASNLEEHNRIHLAVTESRGIKVIFKTENNPSAIGLQAFSNLADYPGTFAFSVYDSLGGAIKVGVLALSPDHSVDRDHPWIISVRGSYSEGGLFGHDMNFMLHTRDTPFPEIITALPDEFDGIVIYPNPVKDFLRLRLPTASPVNLFLFDLHGRTVMHLINEKTDMLDLRTLPRGMYLLVMQTPDRRKVIKILKD
jgi:hypothetical protein